MKNTLKQSMSSATKTLILVVIFFFGTLVTQAQIITTVAGNGSGSPLGDGGPAINASLNTPYGISLDFFGNIYIADLNHNRVRKVTASTGIITTIAGNGQTGWWGDGGLAINAQMNSPEGVCADTFGNVYIAEFGNNKVRKIDSAGIITTVVGTGVQGFSGDGGPAIDAQLYGPNGICLDASGNLYITDEFNQRIRKVDALTGIITTIAGNGSADYSGDGGLAINAKLHYPIGICVDISGNVYIADAYNHRIRKVAALTGIISTVAGNGIGQGMSQGWYSGDGGPAIDAGLNLPIWVSVDTFGNLYISDHSNNRIRKVDGNGIITTIAGTGVQGFSGDGGPADSAELAGPIGIYADVLGDVYIATNERVRKISCNNTYSQLHSDTTYSIVLVSNDTVVAIQIDTIANIVVTTTDSIFTTTHLNTTTIAKDSLVLTTSECNGITDTMVYVDTTLSSIIVVDTIMHQLIDTVFCGTSVYYEIILDTSYTNTPFLIDTFVIVEIDTVSNSVVTTTDSIFISSHVHTMIIVKDSTIFTVGQCSGSIIANTTYFDTTVNSNVISDTLVCESSDTVACPTSTYSQVMLVDSSAGSILLSVDTFVTVQIDTVANDVITVTDSMFVSTYANTTTIVKDSTVFTVYQCSGAVDSIMYIDTSISSATVLDTVVHQSSDTALINTTVANIDILANMKVYPNPFSDKINIDVGDEIVDVVLTDALGRILMQTKGSGHIVIQPNVLSGVYFLRVTYNNKAPVMIKVIAE